MKFTAPTGRLADLVAEKRRKARAGTGVDISGVRPSTRDFPGWLTGRDALSVVGELRWDLGPEPRAFAARLDDAEIDAVIVPTDPAFGGGGLEDLRAISDAHASLPLLRRDLILEAGDVYLSRMHGADAVTLPAGLLDPATLRALVDAAVGTHMTPVAWCWDLPGVERALEAGMRALELSSPAADTPVAPTLLDAVPAHLLVLVGGASLTRDEATTLLGRADAVVLAEALFDDPEGVVAGLKEL